MMLQVSVLLLHVNVDDGCEDEEKALAQGGTCFEGIVGESRLDVFDDHEEF